MSIDKIDLCDRPGDRRHRAGRSARGEHSRTAVRVFVSILRGQMDELVNLQDNAAQMQQALAAGQIDDLSQVVLAVQKADLALNFALQLRNKVVEAYQEVTRMQV